MAFTVEDIGDLLRIIQTHPEWRSAVRAEILGPDVLSLPDLVRQNSEDIRELQAIVRQNGEDIRELQVIVRQNSEDIRKNSEDIRYLGRQVEELVAGIKRIDGRLGSVEGMVTESRWKDHFAGRFGRIVQRARLKVPADLEAFEDAFFDGTISEGEAQAVRELDVIIEGVRKNGAVREPVLLAVEVSTTIETHDIERAEARARTLREVGYPAVAVVAGSRMDASLKRFADDRSVTVLLRAEAKGAEVIVI